MGLLSKLVLLCELFCVSLLYVKYKQMKILKKQLSKSSYQPNFYQVMFNIFSKFCVIFYQIDKTTVLEIIFWEINLSRLYTFNQLKCSSTGTNSFPFVRILQENHFSARILQNNHLSDRFCQVITFLTDSAR